MNFALLLLLFVRPLSAQLQSVDMRVSGLDCASCAGSVEKAVARIRGVETVSFTGERVIIRLKQDNAVTLGRIRDALKGIGYTPNEARVTVRGTARNDRGRWLLATPSGLTFEISRGSREGDALATGVVRPPVGPGARERIEVE
ncbi:MAG: heavy-metal-associated domain-containing protein [Acidobacteria bacterium]|nr:heavy-metal-associated domain-containing protein [Acidobacteriota bacterium]